MALYKCPKHIGDLLVVCGVERTIYNSSGSNSYKQSVGYQISDYFTSSTGTDGSYYTRTWTCATAGVYRIVISKCATQAVNQRYRIRIDGSNVVNTVDKSTPSTTSIVYDSYWPLSVGDTIQVATYAGKVKADLHYQIFKNSR